MPPGTENRLDMRIGCYILFGIATLAVLLRFYFRFIQLRDIGLDDCFVLAAWISQAVVIVSVKLQFDSGIGWHAADLMALPDGVEILTRQVQWPWVAQFLYFFQLGCIKASIVSLYLRLAISPAQRRILWVSLVVVFGQGLSSAAVVAGFLCTPINIVWTNTHGGFGGPACINILAFKYWNAAFFIVTDILLALTPIPVLRNLQMNHRRKIALGIMFGLGLLTIGGTIERQVTNAIAIAINNITDFTWYWAPAELCSVLESSLGIVFICVPALAPLLAGFLDKKTTSQKYDSKLPGTFGKLGGRPRLRLDDGTLLDRTQTTVRDGKQKDPCEYELEGMGSEQEMVEGVRGRLGGVCPGGSDGGTRNRASGA
ncbi:Uu.00g080760.m01.CDS01 [Anthostomella pinea]|uniref:Uu.00g080760.m01.CDS01 n=1 Tax=Anthostomella pinea TaxID=933095 RepID=A0AAI8VL21_9PEZI|nr:Uu.00g080760.m01.CDS01 [Anthostomella pinea]